MYINIIIQGDDMGKGKATTKSEHARNAKKSRQKADKLRKKASQEEEVLLGGMPIKNLRVLFVDMPVENIIGIIKGLKTEAERDVAFDLVPKGKLARIRELIVKK